jgi:hypothetical protein
VILNYGKEVDGGELLNIFTAQSFPPKCDGQKLNKQLKLNVFVHVRHNYNYIQ